MCLILCKHNLIAKKLIELIFSHKPFFIFSNEIMDLYSATYSFHIIYQMWMLWSILPHVKTHIYNIWEWRTDWPQLVREEYIFLNAIWGCEMEMAHKAVGHTVCMPIWTPIFLRHPKSEFTWTPLTKPEAVETGFCCCHVMVKIPDSTSWWILE